MKKSAFKKKLAASSKEAPAAPKAAKKAETTESKPISAKPVKPAKSNKRPREEPAKSKVEHTTPAKAISDNEDVKSDDEDAETLYTSAKKQKTTPAAAKSTKSTTSELASQLQNQKQASTFKFKPFCAPVVQNAAQQSKKKKKEGQQNKLTVALSTQFSSSNPFQRFLFYKQHYGTLKKKSNFTSVFNKRLLGDSDNVEDLSTANKTLFVTNPSHDVSFQNVAQIFEQFGQLTSIHFGDLSSDHEKEVSELLVNPFSNTTNNAFLNQGTVHVVFDEQEYLNKAMEASEPKNAPTNVFVESSSEDNGLDKLFQDYQQVFVSDVKTAEAQLNQWMKDYDKRAEKEEKMIDALRGKPDEDGWVKVIAPKGKRHLAPLTEKDLAKMNEGAKKPRNLQQKEALAKLIPLYEHQKTEIKKQKYQLLRERFEEDKQKIAKMKSQRKFKPF